jgi:hypothetical protein
MEEGLFRAANGLSNGYWGSGTGLEDDLCLRLMREVGTLICVSMWLCVCTRAGSRLCACVRAYMDVCVWGGGCVCVWGCVRGGVGW